MNVRVQVCTGDLEIDIQQDVVTVQYGFKTDYSFVRKALHDCVRRVEQALSDQEVSSDGGSGSWREVRSAGDHG